MIKRDKKLLINWNNLVFMIGQKDNSNYFYKPTNSVNKTTTNKFLNTSIRKPNNKSNNTVYNFIGKVM